jgi:hypothetical protein
VNIHNQKLENNFNEVMVWSLEQLHLY